VGRLYLACRSRPRAGAFSFPTIRVHKLPHNGVGKEHAIAQFFRVLVHEHALCDTPKIVNRSGARCLLEEWRINMAVQRN
jgi:hypothetical protein